MVVSIFQDLISLSVKECKILFVNLGKRIFKTLVLFLLLRFLLTFLQGLWHEFHIQVINILNRLTITQCLKKRSFGIAIDVFVNSV